MFTVQLSAVARKRGQPAEPAAARVYLASSLQTYSDPRYAWMAAAAARHFPGSLIVAARDRYTDSADWRQRWPIEVTEYAAIVIFADAAGCIGRGVYREIEDMRALGRPVFFLDDDGELHAFAAIRLDLVDAGDRWRQYARVRRGRRALEQHTLADVFAEDERRLARPAVGGQGGA